MDLVKWIGGGFLAVLLYVFISNLFWLLVGSAILQKIPGTNIKGIRGTIRIACIIICVASAFVIWTLILPARVLPAYKPETLTEKISRYLRRAGNRLPF